jgi:hypothetical protein
VGDFEVPWQWWHFAAIAKELHTLYFIFQKNQKNLQRSPKLLDNGNKGSFIAITREI